MPCFSPLRAFVTPYQVNSATGKLYRRVIFNEKEGQKEGLQDVSLPCGRCKGCRLEKSRQWAIRCMHEASLYRENCFITLTYSDEHLPPGRSLVYKDFQDFMKRLRKKFTGRTVRFYMAGEYGENFGRPHFHACIFNLDFADKTFWQTTKSGSKLYRSKTLEALWTFGYSSIGDVNFESAAYVARYIMKKMTGSAAAEHYEEIDNETGEVTSRVPEFNKMSLKPGIGHSWLQKFHADVYPNDYVIVNGKKVKPPRFYDKKWAEDFPAEFDEVQWKREMDARLRADDNTPERLAVKEQVLEARLSLLKRKLI